MTAANGPCHAVSGLRDTTLRRSCPPVRFTVSLIYCRLSPEYLFPHQHRCADALIYAPARLNWVHELAPTRGMPSGNHHRRDRWYLRDILPLPRQVGPLPPRSSYAGSHLAKHAHPTPNPTHPSSNAPPTRMIIGVRAPCLHLFPCLSRLQGFECRCQKILSRGQAPPKVPMPIT
jgi:hypothetical protein